MAAAKAVARAVSTKGGGLPGVEVGCCCCCCCMHQFEHGVSSSGNCILAAVWLAQFPHPSCVQPCTTPFSCCCCCCCCWRWCWCCLCCCCCCCHPLQAMALPHGPGVIEVATNLIAYSWCSSPTPRSDATHQAATAAAGSPSQADGGQCSQPDPQEPSSSSSSTSTSSSSSSSSSGQLGVQDSSWGSLTGAGPDEVAAAVAQEARRLGLPPPGPGYVTNKTPPQLLVYAAETLQQS